MSGQSGLQFSCAQCGRRFRFKPEQAGKRAKCPCGAIITIPSAADDDDGGLYDMAEPKQEMRSTRASAIQPVLAAAHSREPKTLAYEDGPGERKNRFAADKLYHAPRDFYWPSGAIAVGFLALLAWAITHAGSSTTLIVIFSGYITVATLIKTAVLIGVAFVVAPITGVSFGGIWTAILKLAAIVVVTDAALFWLQDIMRATGALPESSGGGRGWMGIALVNTLLAAAIIALLLHHFFDMDREDVGSLAVPLAIVNRVLNFVILLIIVAILDAAKSAASASAPAPTATAAAQASAPSPAAATRATTLASAVAPSSSRPISAEAAARDARIRGQIALQFSPMREAREFYESSATKPYHRDFVMSLYASGAWRVYIVIDMRRNVPSEICVEMPDRSEQRSAIFKLFRDFVQTNKLAVDPAKITDEGGHFFSVPLPEWKR